MNFNLQAISSYSMLVPFIIACVKFSRLGTDYKPFFYFIVAGFLSELLCQIYPAIHRPYNTVLNVYFLLQAFYVTWQFRKWELFKKNELFYWIIQGTYCIIWFVEDLYVDNAKKVLSYFVIASNYAMAIMSISIINKLVVKVHGSLWKNPVFLICMGWLLLFTYSVISETFFNYSQADDDFAAKMYSIFQFINIFSNIIFGIAILWIPSKPRFILPSSSLA